MGIESKTLTLVKIKIQPNISKIEKYLIQLEALNPLNKSAVDLIRVELNSLTTKLNEMKK